ncbi:hypothetical protein JOF29_001236 [Kribbella aluminosa]|uniref:DUF222 domain-containing protein n=1 Tax=Kribbella aluminosa TaxID=416017 RepID=A0ABS4UES7_9ACTN|nr:hypothetical protein [Kribbella aluminosa]MBP2350153.1 hypothetical protein [Kribbella aluminosa]
MFEEALEALRTRDLLEEAAQCRVIANGADARVLECAQIYADRYHPSVCAVRPARRMADGRERSVVLGGDGCPEIAEFAIAEFGVVLGVSPGVARDLIADALALRHRFPETWARILASEATPWKARQLVRACTKLDQAGAAYVDQRVAHVVDTLPPYRLDKIITAAKKCADPAVAADEAAQAADERGVYVGRGDKHGNKTIYIKAGAAAVNRFDARITELTDALKSLGDTRPIQHRRAQAIEIMSDPRFTQELLTQARNQAPPSGQAQPDIHPQTHSETRPDDRAESAGEARSGKETQPGNGAQPEEQARADSQDGSDREPRAEEQAPTYDRSYDRVPSGDEALSDDQALSADQARSGERDWCDGRARADLVEPFGPWEDPWLEAAGPYDSDPPSDPFDRRTATEATDAAGEPAEGSPMDAAAVRALGARLVQIKHDTYTNPSYLTQSKGQVRPGQTEVVVHLTDHTAATSTGVLRAEGIGPLLAAQLTELIGHGPYTVQPVIDLNDVVAVDAYEIPSRIRDRVKLTYPVELFPYGTRETSHTIDLDHIEPYDPRGPAKQTSTTNLAPLSRFGHRVKTHARGWSARRIDHRTLEWTTPNGFAFHVDPEGTHRVDRPRPTGLTPAQSPLSPLRSASAGSGHDAPPDAKAGDA